ncbi:MAG: hypothetical protein LBU32_25755 [Clostridiales bacterium]|jgi:hypothetical protein|nr:hypothetical protein [Clostridiales bacterium]
MPQTYRARYSRPKEPAGKAPPAQGLQASGIFSRGWSVRPEFAGSPLRIRENIAEDIRVGLRGAARRKTEDMPFALNGFLDPPGRRRLRRMLDMLDLLSNRQKKHGQRRRRAPRSIFRGSTAFRPSAQPPTLKTLHCRSISTARRQRHGCTLLDGVRTR